MQNVKTKMIQRKCLGQYKVVSIKPINERSPGIYIAHGKEMCDKQCKKCLWKDSYDCFTRKQLMHVLLNTNDHFGREAVKKFIEEKRRCHSFKELCDTAEYLYRYRNKEVK